MTYAELLDSIAKGETAHPTGIRGELSRLSDWLLTGPSFRTILSTVLDTIFPIAKEN